MLTKKIYGLIGRNINYSFSKKYFTQKFKNDKIDNCEYLNFDIDKISDFKKINLSNINGFNVTIPYKEKIIGYLDEIEDSAKNIGAVNTIKILKLRGKAMQEAVPKGEGGMIAVLGSELEILEDIIYKKKNDF